MDPIRVGVDVGGTKILAVAVTGAPAEPRLVATETMAMPGRTASESALEQAIVAAVEQLANRCGGRDAISGVGIAAAGLVDATGEQVRFAPHLPWRDAPVRARLSAALGHDVLLDNDANCAAHAELTAGVAQGRRSALMITIGTGIGGALIMDGRVWRGANGAAGEFGHMQVVPDGLSCECGLSGCWEQYCSGRALERVVRVAIGKHYEGKEVAARARAGDRVAREAIATIGTWLGVGTAGLVAAFDPEVVVIGGGVSADGDLLLGPAREALSESLQGVGHRRVPELVAARFGPDAGAIGAALLTRRG